jgi:hypothetical protein
METYDDITQKHMLTVKEMGILENEIDINYDDLKEISTELGMTEDGWEYVMKLADEKLVLAESHFRMKSYRDCILASEEAQLLNPFIEGARGQKAKAFLLLAIHEEDDSYLEKASTQAKITLDKESNDRNALEVMATLSSKKRLLKKKDVPKTNKTLAILAGCFVLLAAGVVFYMYGGVSGEVTESKEKVELVEKQLESAFSKQEALIPKVEALLKDSKQDNLNHNHLEELKSELNSGDLTIKEKFVLHKELGEVLSKVVYQKSSEKETQLLEDLRVLLEGAENRINTEKKKYNESISDYNQKATNQKEKL